MALPVGARGNVINLEAEVTELRTYLPVVTRGYNNERFSEPNYNDLTPLHGSGLLRYLHCAVAGGSAREVFVFAADGHGRCAIPPNNRPVGSCKLIPLNNNRS